MRTLDTLTTELENKLAITGAAYDYWSETDLWQYINYAIRFISRKGREEYYESLLEISSDFTISGSLVTPNDSIIKFAMPLNISADGVQVQLVTPDELRVLSRNSYQEPSSTNVYAVIHGTKVLVYPEPSAISAAVYVVPTALTSGSQTSPLSDDGDDLAVEYAYGEALKKGQFDLAGGIAVQDKVKEMIR